MGMIWVMARASDHEVAALRADPESIYDFVYSEEAHTAGRSIDLDKEWHAVHFLLTGTADVVNGPLGLILGMFEEVGPDHGYGPAWFIPAKAVCAFHTALSAHSDEEWARRYDAAAAVSDQVYLAEALADEGEEALGFLQADVARLRAFVSAAVDANDNAFALIT